MVNRHKWTIDDDYIVFVLYFKNIKEKNSIDNVSQKIGCGTGSLRMRIKNFKYIETGIGLSNYSEMSKKVYDELSNNTEKRNKIISDVERILSP